MLKKIKYYLEICMDITEVVFFALYLISFILCMISLPFIAVWVIGSKGIDIFQQGNYVIAVLLWFISLLIGMETIRLVRRVGKGRKQRKVA